MPMNQPNSATDLPAELDEGVTAAAVLHDGRIDEAAAGAGMGGAGMGGAAAAESEVEAHPS